MEETVVVEWCSKIGRDRLRSVKAVVGVGDGLARWAAGPIGRRHRVKAIESVIRVVRTAVRLKSAEREVCISRLCAAVIGVVSERLGAVGQPVAVVVIRRCLGSGSVVETGDSACGVVAVVQGMADRGAGCIDIKTLEASVQEPIA